MQLRLPASFGWAGMPGRTLRCSTRGSPRSAGAVVLALGGASWPRLGSDGAWAGANAGPGVAGPVPPGQLRLHRRRGAHMHRHAGTPLKRIAVSPSPGAPCPATPMLTGSRRGGRSVLRPVRRRCATRSRRRGSGHRHAGPPAGPDAGGVALSGLAAPRRAQSLSTFLRKAAGLCPPVSVALLRECAGTPDDLAGSDQGAAGAADRHDRAGARDLHGGRITAGTLHGLADRGVFAAGEMLDWEAPTGGYLLQAAFSTGFAAGEAALVAVSER